MNEIHSFSLVDYVRKRNGADVRFCHVALFLIVEFLLFQTFFYSNEFCQAAHVSFIEAQIARGDTVRKSGLLQDFARVSYMDPNPYHSFQRYCQIQCGLAPIFLLPDQRHEYMLLNGLKRPTHLPQGYRLVHDFGHGLLLLRKA